MAHQYDYVPTAAAQETALEILDASPPDVPVSEHRVLERMEQRGFDHEESRRALQRLLADEEITVTDDGIFSTG
ncbi:hypothetical protein RYH80_14755 [Halobaculum sp. MBLA0147]|uniref:hypothetical protein n=1 Tax=Halobaculum sp. MBLA0147 TaxID=3079934 RepID=UPI003523C42E